MPGHRNEVPQTPPAARCGHPNPLQVWFHRCGKKAMIDSAGNLILRPSYFELSITHRGTAARHHLTSSYALSFAAILRAQVGAGLARTGPGCRLPMHRPHQAWCWGCAWGCC